MVNNLGVVSLFGWLEQSFMNDHVIPYHRGHALLYFVAYDTKVESFDICF